MGDERVVVLKGIPARTPRAWPRRTPLTAAAVLVLLQRLVAWSLAAAGHLALAALFLVFVREASQPVGDATVSLRVHQGGEERGKEAKVEVPVPPPAPVVEERRSEPVPEAPKPVPQEDFVAATPVTESKPAPVPGPVPEAPPASIGGGATGSGTPVPEAPAAAPVTEADVDRDPTEALRRKRRGCWRSCGRRGRRRSW
jgi:outer membrane biosynthesis protein TonB